MPLSFNDLLAADLGQVLDENELAEPVEITSSAGGNPLTASAVVVQRAQPKIEGRERSSAERLEVYLSRTAEIDRLPVGSPLRRSAEIDPSRRPYAFTGEVLERDSQGIVLVFERARVFALGTTHAPG